MPGVTIGYHSIVDGCILEEGVHIGRYCYVGFGAGSLSGQRGVTVLGSDLVVPDRTAIGHACRVTSEAARAAFKAGVVPSGTSLVC
jgi:acyl-[acyl carrier protein]--UDP-N-acetylglucosamine O-acyltransferase